MNLDYTHVTMLLDSSGSMKKIWEDTIGGFNVFLESQKSTPGKMTLSQIHFSSGKYRQYRTFEKSIAETSPNIWNCVSGGDLASYSLRFRQKTVSIPYAVVNDFSDIQKVEQLSKTTFVPGGGTPLLDCIHIAIDDTGKALSQLAESERPGKVLFIILTDGEENASQMYNYSDIEQIIKHQTEVYNWTFTYLGANQDAIKEASKLGVSTHNSLTYSADSRGISTSFGLLGEKTATLRSSAVGSVAYASAMNYSDQERSEAMGGNFQGSANTTGAII
jgi:hypothetical protein